MIFDSKYKFDTVLAIVTADVGTNLQRFKDELEIALDYPTFLKGKYTNKEDLYVTVIESMLDKRMVKIDTLPVEIQEVYRTRLIDPFWRDVSLMCQGYKLEYVFTWKDNIFGGNKKKILYRASLDYIINRCYFVHLNGKEKIDD